MSVETLSEEDKKMIGHIFGDKLGEEMKDQIANANSKADANKEVAKARYDALMSKLDTIIELLRMRNE